MGLLPFFLLAVLTQVPAQTTATTVRLPLPVDSPVGVTSFEVPGPTASVLTGLLWPAAGPLTAWAPVFSSFQADGTLKEAQTGSWVGPRPGHWLRVVKPGFVVGGFRVLLKTSPGVVQTRQIQIFWKPWSEGEAVGHVVESQVYGEAAGRNDQVKIIELRLPEGGIPTGLYGETLSGSVVQASLIVRLATPAAEKPPTPSSAPSRVLSPAVPRLPLVGPVEPVATPPPF